MAEAPAPPTVPFAPKRPTERIVHGVRLVDDYAWLRDENWREMMRDPAKLAPEIRAYLEAENKHAEVYFADASELQKRLVAEMRGRIKEDDSTVPSRDGAFAYYVRYREGGQHPLLCRVPSAGGDEQLLLDGDALAEGHAYYNLGAFPPRARPRPAGLVGGRLRAPNISPSACANWRPARSLPTRCRTRPAARCGPRTAALSIT